MVSLILAALWGCGGPPSAGDAAAPRPLPPVRPVARTVHLDGVPVTVHALPTGTVTIKRCHHSGCLPEAAPGLLRFAAIVADRRFAAPMPIWTYLVVHPDGHVLVDAGADRAFADPDSWATDPGTGRFVRSFLRLDVPPGAQVEERLAALGIAPHTIDHVVLTHQHLDHTAGVPRLPSARVWTTRAEAAVQADIGAVPWRWAPPEGRLGWVDEEGEAGLFPREVALMDRLVVAHTPGHTPGSVTVRLEADEGTVWFTGDTTFTDDLDPRAPTAGIHTDMAGVRALQARLGELTRGGLVLPSHDPSVPERLTAWRTP